MGTKAEPFALAHGATCLDDLSEITIVQAKEFIQIFNDQQTHTTKLGGLHINHLAALIYWVRDDVCRQQPIVAAE